MASSKRQRRPLPKGYFRLVSVTGEVLGVRFERNGRYYDMGISEVSALLYGDFSPVNKLPCILLENVGGDYISKAELNGLYTCYDISSFVEKNLTMLTSFDTHSISNSKNVTSDFIDKFLLVRALIEDMKHAKGYSGSVMRERDGLGILVRNMTVEYSKTGKMYMVVSILVSGVNRLNLEFLNLLVNNHFSSREKALSREDKFVTLIVTHKELHDIMQYFRKSVFFNTISPVVTCKDMNAMEVFKFYGSFKNGSLEFIKSPDVTKRERKVNVELFDASVKFISETFDSPYVDMTTDNLLLDVNDGLIESGYLQVQPIE